MSDEIELPLVQLDDRGAPLHGVEEHLIAIGDVYKVYMNDLVEFRRYTPFVDQWVEIIRVDRHGNSVSVGFKIVGSDVTLDSCAPWRLYMPPGSYDPRKALFVATTTQQVAPHRRRKLWL